jgi:hypothetical protein
MVVSDREEIIYRAATPTEGRKAAERIYNHDRQKERGE